MTKLSITIGALFLLSLITFQLSEKDLFGTWKIIKVKNSLGSEIDSTAFTDETFTYKKNHSIIHFNPNNPIEQKQVGKWEIKNDTLYQFNEAEEKMPFNVLSLTTKNLTLEQKNENVITTIYYRKL